MDRPCQPGAVKVLLAIPKRFHVGLDVGCEGLGHKVDNLLGILGVLLLLILRGVGSGGDLVLSSLSILEKDACGGTGAYLDVACLRFDLEGADELAIPALHSAGHLLDGVVDALEIFEDGCRVPRVQNGWEGCDSGGEEEDVADADHFERYVRKFLES